MGSRDGRLAHGGAEKLAALVPRPHVHTIHFYGVLAPAAKWRPLIVPSTGSGASENSGNGAEDSVCPHLSGSGKKTSRRRNYTWSELLKRVFAVDILECPRCFGRMKIIAAIQAPDVARKILDCLGLSSRPPPVAPARTAHSTSFECF